MTKMRYALAVLLTCLFLAACRSSESSGCTLPPKGFSEADLVGFWHAVDFLKDSSITIRGDGRYAQTVYVKRTGFRYESDWLPWRVTYPERSLPYLHLEGFLMCAYWDQLECDTARSAIEPLRLGDTKDPFGDADYWYDFCQSDWVSTPGEAVFMVEQVPARFSQPPRGISLSPFTRSTETNTGPEFELREP